MQRSITSQTDSFPLVDENLATVYLHKKVILTHQQSSVLNMKKIVIIQSNYIPWKGYFDMIAAADEFIFHDDRQYTKNDWRNRNKIKTQNGVQWLTIPVGTNEKRKISDVVISPEQRDKWQKKHWNIITANYINAPYFSEISSLIAPLYLEKKYIYLSQVNYDFIFTICNYLRINTKFRYSSEFNARESKNERLIDMLTQAGATEYISGQAAKAYIDEKKFADNRIKLTWFDHTRYPAYPQLWGDFIHKVSMLDVLFNCGKDSAKYMQNL